MAKIVGVHGISQEYRGSHVIKSEWLPSLKDGLNLAGVELASDDEFQCAFYGDLFRGKPKGIGSDGIPNYGVNDVKMEWEKELLAQWWAEVAAVEPEIKGPSEIAPKKSIGMSSVQMALRALSRSRYFGKAGEKIVIYFLKQVGGYIHNPDVRGKVRERVVASIDTDTRVLIGHSLGSIVCYELLCAHPEWNIDVFVSLGSPLGIQTLIYDRLEPLPQNKQGQWPGSIKRWVNIADKNDVVALEKSLEPLFKGSIEDYLVDNGGDFHNASHYLTAVETGEAIKLGLS